LPCKVSQQVLMLLDRSWKSFFAAIKAYTEKPDAFTGRPGLPRYLDKTKGRYALVYTVQALSRPALAQQVLKPSGLAIEVKATQTRIAQVRIVPRSGFLHTHSRRIIDLLVREGIGVLIVGKNDGWKQQITIGRQNNQNFVQVPHARFIQMLLYKAELVGIEVRTINESHTNKCSFLDAEPIGGRSMLNGGR
jgi:IS605 OrfB family transposase